MKMLYHTEICASDRSLNGWGIFIRLWPEWREAVARYDLDQKRVDTAVSQLGRGWLDNCGFGTFFDPDNCGCDRDPDRPPGPRAKPMYAPNVDLRVTWGEWGTEHITVPGNACGLDLDNGIGAPKDGRTLSPHNLDTMRQACLLLMVFSWFANAIVTNEMCLEYRSTMRGPAKDSQP